MNILKTIFAVCLAGVALFGCSSYQLASTNKSTIVDTTSADTITVTFCGNAYMSKEDVERYALQRAALEALSKGCAYFVIEKKDDNSEICALDSRMNNKITSRAMGQPDITKQPDLAILPSGFVEPNITLTIRCLRAGQEIPETAINAQEFLDKNFPGLGA